MNDELMFCSDYMRGCHPEILKRLVATNMEASPGYGTDQYTAKARRKIAEACGLDPDKCLVEFLIGGTQTNATVIDAILRSYEGVLTAETGHINVHEAGAIEFGGHKVISLPSKSGKLSAKAIADYFDEFSGDETRYHMVRPALVYVSFPTELGTLYTLSELEAISDVCHSRGLKLYVDGARLAYGLKAPENDVTLPNLAHLADVFYIGGTKCGALFGEAVVASEARILPDFFTIVKQHGALLAKGRLLGIQFDTLFTDNLYERIGERGIEMARYLGKMFESKGIKVFIDSPTNQQFFIIPNAMIERLRHEGVGFELWGPMRADSTPVRFVTDWSTTPESIEALSELLE